jgi:hypothetical protein
MYGRIARLVPLAVMLAGPHESLAGGCLVDGPRYQLAEDTVDWSMMIGRGQNCLHGVRFASMRISKMEVLSPPQSGHLTLGGIGFSYTAKADFQGEDTFAVGVSGVSHGIPGNSTIRITVLVIGVSGREASGSQLHPSAASPLPRAAPSIPAMHSASIAPTSEAVPGWKPLKIGAGGFITGIEIAPDGTKVARTDTYGAYIWDIGTSAWKQLVTTYSMPASDAGFGAAGGVYEIAIASSQTSRLYMLFNGYVFRSDDRGDDWVRTGFKHVAGIDPNASTRLFGRYMTVDPANPDIVYVSTPSNGLWRTEDGGGSWSQLNAVAIAGSSGLDQGGGHLIAFDLSSGVIGGRTQGIYASSYGAGVYHSIDGGKRWTLTPGTPTTHRHLVVDRNGAAYLTDNSGGTNNVNKWNGTAWSKFPIGNRGHSIAIDPANASRIFVGIDSGDLITSTNGGASWVGPTFSRATRAAADIPWLAWTNETYMTNGDMTFDPSGSNLLYFAEGIGVWHCNPPNGNAAVAWTSQSAGIEELVGNVVLAPDGGQGTNPIVLAWDRPVFYVDDRNVYPSAHGPNRAHSIISGWSADWASTSPRTIVAIMNWWGKDESGISTNGGQTWASFPSLPREVPTKIGGSIAAASATNFVWVPSNNGNPWYTVDGGASWSEISIPGVPSTGETGWGFAYYLNRQIVAADRVNAGTFYLYNSGAATAPGATGLYKSSDKGASWIRVFSGEISTFSGFNAKLKSVPGQTGHLFFTSGPQQSATHPANTRFMRSLDGGATWKPVGNLREVYAFGFGAIYPGQTYPAIFAAGYNDGTWGIWRSIDNAATWTMIGDFPLGIFDKITSVDGDKVVVGAVYVSFGGSGFAYLQ